MASLSVADIDSRMYEILSRLCPGEGVNIVIDTRRFRCVNRLDVSTKILKKRCADCDKLFSFAHECVPVSMEYDEDTKLWKGVGKVPYDIRFVNDLPSNRHCYSFGDGLYTSHLDQQQSKRKRKRRRTRIDGVLPNNVICTHVII